MIVVDIGGTFIKYAIYDDVYEAIRTPKGVDMLEKLIFELTADESCIGLAVCGAVDEGAKRVLKSSNLPALESLDIPYMFRNKKYILVNDAVAACYGEAHFGIGKEMDNFLAVTLGTAIGGSYYFRSGGFERVNPIELSHFTLAGNDFMCSCGKKGCLQTVASTESLLKNTGCSELFEVFDLNNEDRFKAHIEEYLNSIAIVISNALMSVNTRNVLIGGGIVKSGYPICEKLREKLKIYTFAADKSEINVVRMKLEDNAALLGLKYLLMRG